MSEINVKVTIFEADKTAHVSVNGVSISIIKYVRGAKFSEISGILRLYNSQKREIAQVSVMRGGNIRFFPKENSKFEFDGITDEVKIGL